MNFKSCQSRLTGYKNRLRAIFLFELNVHPRTTQTVVLGYGNPPKSPEWGAQMKESCCSMKFRRLRLNSLSLRRVEGLEIRLWKALQPQPLLYYSSKRLESKSTLYMSVVVSRGRGGAVPSATTFVNLPRTRLLLRDTGPEGPAPDLDHLLQCVRVRTLNFPTSQTELYRPS